MEPSAMVVKEDGVEFLKKISSVQMFFSLHFQQNFFTASACHAGNALLSFKL